MKIRALVTGATGMVCEDVLQECLNSDDLAEVLVRDGRSGGVTGI